MKKVSLLILVFMCLSLLYLGWGYVQAQKDMALNGRYQISSGQFSICGIDTRTGTTYNVHPKSEIPK